MADAGEVTFDDLEARTWIQIMISEARNVSQHAEIVGAISAIVYRDVIDHFKTQDGPNGAWPVWSNIYAQHMYHIRRQNNKILQFNGKLRQNFAPSDHRSTNEGLEWFNNAKTKSGYPYAWGHNYGDKKLPQRQFMWLSQEAMDTIADIVLNKIVGED